MDDALRAAGSRFVSRATSAWLGSVATDAYLERGSRRRYVSTVVLADETLVVLQSSGSDPSLANLHIQTKELMRVVSGTA